MNRPLDAFTLLFSLLAASSVLSPLAAEPQPATRRIGNDAAQAVVLQEIHDKYSGWTELPSFGLDPYEDPYFPDFYWFDANWDNPAGSVHLAIFAVNAITGDLWDPDLCRRLRFRWLSDRQRRFRTEAGLTRAQFRAYSHRAPCQAE